MAQVLENVNFSKFVDLNDTTKILQLSLSGATTGTITTLNMNSTGNNSITMPNATTTLVGIDTTDTLINKTLNNANINGIITSMPFVNSTYTGTTGVSSGIVSNYKATSIIDTVATGGFTNAINSMVKTTGTGIFSSGDIIQITNANNSNNNGLYEVFSHTSNTLTIKGTPTYDFFKTSFITDSTVAGNITKINISAMRTNITSGSWEIANASTTSSLTFASIGSITSISAGTGLSGGTITSNGTISLSNTAVTPGSYNLTSLTVNAQGQITSASSGSAVTSIIAGTGLNGGTITSTGTISIANTTVLSGSYSLASVTVNSQGQITSASNGSAVTSITAGTGLNGGTITSSGTISLSNTGVLAGSYTRANFTVDSQGRITTASSGSAVTSITAGTGLSGGTITTSGTISLTNTAVLAGSYTLTNLTVDAQGRLTAASNGSAVTSITAGTGLSGGTITSTGTISLSNTGVLSGSYTLSNITIDSQGRITTASNGSAVTSITAGTGLSGGTITSSGTIAIASTGVTAGSYTSANITVNAQGQITAASNGSTSSFLSQNFTGTYTPSSSTQILNDGDLIIPYTASNNDLPGVTYAPATGIFTFSTGGKYRITVAQTFAYKTSAQNTYAKLALFNGSTISGGTQIIDSTGLFFNLDTSGSTRYFPALLMMDEIVTITAGQTYFMAVRVFTNSSNLVIEFYPAAFLPTGAFSERSGSILITRVS